MSDWKNVDKYEKLLKDYESLMIDANNMESKLKKAEERIESTIAYMYIHMAEAHEFLEEANRYLKLREISFYSSRVLTYKKVLKILE